MGIDLFKKPAHLIARDADDILGVTDKDELRRRLELICAAIKHPVTLYCFYDFVRELDSQGREVEVDGKPAYEQEDDGHPKMIRIDSNIASVTLHWCCETFRICAGCRYCIQNDLDHARLYRCIEDKDGLIAEQPIDMTDPDAFERLINQRIDDLWNRQDAPIYHNELPDENKTATKPVFIREGNSGYIDYRCSILGFHELIFPVAVSGRVLGAIFCGQISKEEDYNTICQVIRTNFLETHPNIFSNYYKLSINNGSATPLDENSLRKQLDDGDDRYQTIPQFPLINPDDIEQLKKYINIKRNPVLSSVEYKKLIKTSKNEIEKLQLALEELLKDRRQDYIRRVVRKAIQDFNNTIPSVLKKIGTDPSSISTYWQAVEELLMPLAKTFPLRELMIFGPNNITMGTGNYAIETWLPCVSMLPNYDGVKSIFKFQVKGTDKYSTMFLLASHQIEDYKIDDSVPTLTDRVQYQATPDVKNLIHAYNTESDRILLADVFYIPVRDSLSHSSAIVWRFESKNTFGKKLALEDVKYIEDEIRKEMVQLVTLIFYVNWYLLDSVLQANTEMVLRFFRHEIAHVLLGFGWLNDNYIQNFAFGRLADDKREDVAGDFRSTENMLRYIEQNIQLLTKPAEEVDLQKEKFLIFKEILIKWELMYRDTLREKHLRIIRPEPSFWDDYRPLVFSDKRLVEQIVYNIVSNAIKYCYWGTNIYLDCRKPDLDADHQFLTIRDFGHQITNDLNRPYELYFREPNPKLNIEGSGIGLYVVKKICDLLGFTVGHTCTEVSKYNVPLINEYLSRAFSIYPKDPALVEKLEKERNRISALRMQEIVCDGQAIGALNEKQLIDMIHIHTYEVTITVKIPNK